ncbi:Lysosome-associated membrane glycoprotein (Lamp) [Nesidiocoris tenuis]|uniref:Lysosome-associated membrane glycoprotein (Lamp) n=1 Tax=Nesidiocoris tenuis TaxID=355587 RepID=A0ABN7A9N9_9HEMI|nr:Lysosome-associated membrane glycoprotein (Lamp) [Nesidiocoris tenuis]
MPNHNFVFILFATLPFVMVSTFPYRLNEFDMNDGLLPYNYREPVKRLEISNFKTENRKIEKAKEMTNKNMTHVMKGTDIGTDAALYRLKAESGGTCILLKVDALVGFKYTTKLGEDIEKDTFVPNSAIVNGDCSNEDKQRIVLKWKSFVLIMDFTKTPGGERWFVSEVVVKFDSGDHFFEHIKNPGRTYALSTIGSHGSQLLFPTPVGKSYWCDREIEVELTNAETDTTATLFLRDMKLEPFIFKNDEFGPEYKCSATGAGTYRSETAPLVAGSLLASACLITVIGYAIYRYFNIEKVQYDTME